MKSINKKSGKKIIHKASDMEEVSWLSTGVDAIDFIIGGGLPKGRMVSIKGFQSASKTTLSLAIIAEAQKNNVPCVFVDAEWSLNLTHAQTMGVDLDKLTVISSDTAEEAIEAIEEVLDDNMLVVVDSVAALSARAEAEATINEPGIALQARLMSRALRRLTPMTAQKSATIVWVNQLRHSLGVSYTPYSETGGNALKFYSSVSLELKKTGTLKSGDSIIGQEVTVTVVKNKVGKPGGKCILNLIFDEGFSGKVPIIDKALEEGWVTKEGNTYYYEGEKIGVGKDKAEQYINDHLLDKIKDTK